MTVSVLVKISYPVFDVGIILGLGQELLTYWQLVSYYLPYYKHSGCVPIKLHF